MFKIISNKIREMRQKAALPEAARAELKRDGEGLPTGDPGLERSVDESIGWLLRAQENSASADGGVARDFSLINGWASSYPETTGYIIPTLLEYAEWKNDELARNGARKMLDWCVSIQFDDGGFQGGKIDSKPVVPVTFNTGQILLGLAAGVRVFGEPYSASMHKAANWLRDSLDEDGCWRKHPTPFAKPGEKAYETHVSWGLFEAARLDPHQGWGEAGLRNVDWALTKQKENGWFGDCCLNEPSRPLTHTIGYVLRGVLEAYRLSGDERYLAAARKTAEAIIRIVDEEGYLPGRLDADWRPAVKWVCLTGSVQIAHCLLLLHEMTGKQEYRAAAFRLNRFVRRTMKVAGDPDVRGGIKGSFPVDGDYGSFEYLNWAAKFFADANMLEYRIREKEKNGQEEMRKCHD